MTDTKQSGDKVIDYYKRKNDYIVKEMRKRISQGLPVHLDATVTVEAITLSDDFKITIERD